MGLRGWALFLAGLLLLAFIFSHPLALHLRSGMPYSFLPVPGLELLHQHPGDYLQLMYRFWLFEKALEGRTAFFSNAFEFSTPRTPPTFVTQGIPISFLFMLFMPLGNIAAYNALVVLSFLAAGAAMALREGLRVNAGHGLTYWNVRSALALPGLEELNIGHSIISRAVLVGLERAVREMKELIRLGPEEPFGSSQGRVKRI